MFVSYQIKFRTALRGCLFFVMFANVLFACPASVFSELNVDRLPTEDIVRVKGLIEKLAPLIKERDEQQNLSTLTFSELYAPLNKKERKFLKSFQKLDGKKLGVKIPYRGIATGKEELYVVKWQKITVTKDGKTGEEILPPQFVPLNVYEQYLSMMLTMEQDIGKRLLIESCYRSSAYQLYLFIFYLKNHDYSIRETVKFVALPGYSEHGSPAHQAIDFINAEGINGEDNPQEFEDIEEYQWLLKNAGRFDFVLSYPKDAGSGITYEPWHWRYEQAKRK